MNAANLKYYLSPDTHYLQLDNVPPRTKSVKLLNIRSVPHEGSLAIDLNGGWSEYKPNQVQQLIDVMQQWLNDLLLWICPKCFANNYTTKLEKCGWQKFDWVRCQNCRKKTKRENLTFEKLPV